MNFDQIVITTRTRQSLWGLSGSFAGVYYEGKTHLIGPSDSKISLQVAENTDSRGLLWVYVVYIGRYLDKVLNVGYNRFQLFRLHYESYDVRNPSVDRLAIAGTELIATRSTPWCHQERRLSYEHLCGLSEPPSVKAFEGMLEVDPVNEYFTACPVQLAPSIQEYSRHPLWHPHPGMIKSADPIDYMEYSCQETRQQNRDQRKVVQ